MGVPALGIAPVADEKAHADPTDSLGRSALMQQLTKSADEMLQVGTTFSISLFVTNSRKKSLFFFSFFLTVIHFLSVCKSKTAKKLTQL